MPVKSSALGLEEESQGQRRPGDGRILSDLPRFVLPSGESHVTEHALLTSALLESKLCVECEGETLELFKSEGFRPKPGSRWDESRDIIQSYI